MKNAVFWDVAPCGSCKNGPFGGTYHLHHQGDKSQRARNNVGSKSQLMQAALLVTVNVVPRSPIPVTLMMAAKHSSQSSVLTRATWCHFPEDGILRSVTLLPCHL
jgi:hypothetical protein